LFLLPAALFFAALAVAQVQTEPITEPRAQQKPAPTFAKGAAAITQQQEKCSTRLIVNADALFQPHRWTLNHDASETLDALGPMITKAGKHPTNLLGYTAVSDSGSENRNVGKWRALTVRTWLVNHRFLTADATIGGLSPDNSVVPPPEALRSESQRKNGVIWISIDTCH
jgi:outer membrane protein OmpA-like peptidoglycan-associated protein